MEDNIEEVRNMILISLATRGGFTTEAGKGKIRIHVTLQNSDKTDPDKEIFHTFVISKKIYLELQDEAFELHTQIDEMVDEEEMKKKTEEDKKKKELADKKAAKVPKNSKKKLIETPPGYDMLDMPQDMQSIPDIADMIYDQGLDNPLEEGD